LRLDVWQEKRSARSKAENAGNEQADRHPSGQEIEMIIMRDGFKYFAPE
jgi:hypothetical protein